MLAGGCRSFQEAQPEQSRKQIGIGLGSPSFDRLVFVEATPKKHSKTTNGLETKHLFTGDQLSFERNQRHKQRKTGPEKIMQSGFELKGKPPQANNRKQHRLPNA